jgi:hypothetical protein
MCAKKKAALKGGIPCYGGIPSLEGSQPTFFELARQPPRRWTSGKTTKDKENSRLEPTTSRFRVSASRFARRDEALSSEEVNIY